MADEIADETLMARYRDGDAAAFAVLYERHRSGLYRFCLRMCRDPGRAQDVFQDAWMNLVNARERYRPEARFRTFLYQIARNRVIDLARRDGHGAVSLDDDEGPGAAIAESLAAPTHDEPDRLLDRRRDLERVLDAVERLPAAQREAFLLHEEGELTLEEIAQLTGVGRETAKSRLRYALERLRAMLQPEVAS
ncbi:MAG: RNA polymerase sigma factor [Burkholderiales bacterium]|nr:RNA polymerase sigma factor [Burkholderiales bacterium]